jgi:hypothetical protein
MVAVSGLKIPSSRLLKTSLSATTAPPSTNLGWDTHKAVDSIPESLVKTIDGNDGMRRRFEQLTRRAQVRLEAI